MKSLKEFIKRKFITGDINRNDRVGALYRSWGHVYTNFLSGDYLEFGVYHGDSLVNSYIEYLKFREHILAQLKSNEKWRNELAAEFSDFQANFHALDTFEGMPENDENFKAFSKGYFKGDLEAVTKRCEEVGLVAPQLRTYKGLFKDTSEDLKKAMGGRKAAIINIDCDLYESTVDVIKVVEPYIQVGTVLLLDDYNAFCADNTKGGRRAIAEFVKSSQLKFEPWFAYHFVGQSFLCVEKSA